MFFINFYFYFSAWYNNILLQIPKAMPTVNEVMHSLQEYNSPSTKNTLMKHGAREPFYGVKVGDLKTIIKELKLKKEYQLALDLYNTGNSDAMYLAGLIVDEKKISKDDLRQWVKAAYWHMLHDYTVAWVAAESPHGLELGLEWIESPEETIASAGWATLAYWAQLRPNAELDLALYQQLLERVQKNIHQAQNRVRYTMNGFIIMVGSQFPALTEYCIELSESLGTIYVDMGGTSCKVPDAGEYIFKIQEKGTIGKKKKMVRC